MSTQDMYRALGKLNELLKDMTPEQIMKLVDAAGKIKVSPSDAFIETQILKVGCKHERTEFEITDGCTYCLSCGERLKGY